MRVATFFTTFFFNKMSKHTILLRVGLLCCFDLTFFLVITGKNHILQKKRFITVFPNNDQNMFVFLAHIYLYIIIYLCLRTIYIYIYIKINIYINVCVCICVYIYIYMYNN